MDLIPILNRYNSTRKEGEHHFVGVARQKKWGGGGRFSSRPASKKKGEGKKGGSPFLKRPITLGTK